MKNYLNYMVKNSKWCIAVTVAVLMLLTIGLPSNTGWHSIREIEDKREMFGAILLLVATVALSWLQVYNEYSRPKRNGNG